MFGTSWCLERTKKEGVLLTVVTVKMKSSPLLALTTANVVSCLTCSPEKTHSEYEFLVAIEGRTLQIPYNSDCKTICEVKIHKQVF